MELAILIWIVCGIASAVVASNRGGSGCLWFGLGVVLGPIGFALAFTTGVKCPQCASTISERAEICPHCGQAVIPQKGASEDENEDEAEAEPEAASSKVEKVCCPYCAEGILAAAKKCKHCGEFLPLASGGRFCTECGKPLTEGTAFCGHCGKPVADMVPPKAAD
jgi:predicted amidophosphoribosyltransferase